METHNVDSSLPLHRFEILGLAPDLMTKEIKHICVCVCTYKRPQLLKRLLEELCGQDTGGLFTYSIVVVDNDHLRSAQAMVLEFAAASSLPIMYCVEPRQNIALARNTAIKNTHGEFIAFIDDDEFPTKRWLLILFKALNEYKADGALGPVKPHFDVEPPKWIVQGKFYERRTYPTGFVIDWRKGRTGNVLLKRHILIDDAQLFRPEFRTGEDQDFFRRLIKKGHVFIWCNEAEAYEVVPPERWKRTFILKRALLEGTISRLHPTFGALDIAKSALAVPAYITVLPIALILGHSRLMLCLMKLFSHVGRLLALVGINPVREPYVTE
jgi:glycosyltransferase involved in cell wall biosynthesis